MLQFFKLREQGTLKNLAGGFVHYCLVLSTLAAAIYDFLRANGRHGYLEFFSYMYFVKSQQH